MIIWMNDGKSGSWEPQILHKFNDVVWHVSWSITGNILAVSGGDNKVCHVSVGVDVSCVSGCVMCQWVCHVLVGMPGVCDVRKVSCQVCNGSTQLQPHICKTNRDKCHLKMVSPRSPWQKKIKIKSVFTPPSEPTRSLTKLHHTHVQN